MADRRNPRITECDKSTSDDCYVARTFVWAVSDLDRLTERLSDDSETNTAVVKSKLFPRPLPLLP
ncbi:hypothetical protein CLG96_04175 [Sphingomonas oleivorans]|uniref:Uncharacterized protein n=1 Tax=Sphingomonas oleivorans TaxID=1735121 RepID=A0A2T5G2G1_9SPHN|nr:hypothetical protein [Sphingomonas oleivorans]PTQ13310.1 hypothetical protein CLG96_04175 [Sphingomonas oleivorans]